MEKWIETLTMDNAALLLGVVLLLAGIFAPRRFASIEMAWNPALSLAGIVMGAVFIILSFPQMRFWESDTVNVPRSVLAEIKKNTEAARDYAARARANNDPIPNGSRAEGTLAQDVIPKLDALLVRNTLTAKK